MHRDKLTRLIIALVLMAAMVAILLGVGVWMYVSVQPEPAVSATVPPSTAGSNELTTSADFQPDRSKLFVQYDGVLLDAQGREVTLASLRGEPVVLFFWSSWCSDCKEYFDGEFRSAVEVAQAAGARFLLAARGNMRGETHETASACLEGYGFDLDTLMDPDAALFQALGLRSVPSLAFFNAGGVLMYAASDMPDAQEMTAMVDYASGGAAQQTERLIASMTDMGGIASACVVEQDRLAVRKTILSETQGLMMQYALRANRQPLFDYTLTYARNSMTRSGLCAWQTVDGVMADVNASLDDLRLVEALILADQQWGGYGEEASYRERALYNHCVREGWMRDFADPITAQTAQSVTLCYQDVAAMRTLAAYRQEWNALADKAQALLQRGIVSEECPLYWPRYIPETDSFEGELLQMNEAMVTVLNAVRAGVAQESTLDWLQVKLQEGYLAGVYTLQGEVAAGYEFESTATYALLVQIGIAAQRPQMALMAMQQMEKLRSFTAPLVGGYGHTEGMMLYTFDLIEPMLAWQAWGERP